jgi:protease I
MNQSGKRVAFVLGPNYEDIEAKSPLDAVAAAGGISTIIGIEKGPVKGKKGASLDATHTFDEVSPDDFDMLVIAGGGSPENLRIHQPAVAFTREFVGSGKPVASICHGPQLLISADVLKGRKLTSVNKIRDDVKNAGGLYEDAELVIDGNLITSRTPRDLEAFDRAIVDALAAVPA